MIWPFVHQMIITPRSFWPLGIILERESRSSLFENQEIYYRRQPVRKQGSRQILLIARLGSRHFEVPNLGEIHSHYRDFVFQKHDYVRIGIRNRG